MMLLALALLSFIAALLVIFRSHHAYMFYSWGMLRIRIGLVVTLVQIYISEITLWI
jgi:hypothetical protein